jgi:hypothetical protein
MKVIADDEEDSAIVLGGGKVTPEEKKEYMVSYYGIIDARKESNKEKEKEYADKLLEELRSYLEKEVEDLSDNGKETERLKEEGYSEDKIPSMLFSTEEIHQITEDIVKIWDSIDPEETDHILKVNLVSIQCSYLFTKYAKNREAPGKFNRIGEGNMAPIQDNFYTDYKAFKNNLELMGLHEFVVGYTNNPTELEIYYLINMLPFISLTDMIEAWQLKSIWIVGFSTRFQYTDGNNWNNPIDFLTHDYLHARNSFYCYNTVFGGNSRKMTTDNRIRTFNLIKDFYDYVTNKYDNDKPKLYSIKLLIFTAYHEPGNMCISYFTNASNQDQFKLSLWGAQQHTFISRFSDENDLFLSLPPRIRDKAMNAETNIIDKEVIKAYFLEECIPNYTTELHEFQREKNLFSGGRRTRRQRRRRSTKRRKSRR